MAKNQTQMKAQWQIMKGRVRESWGALTDDDVDRTQGNWDQLVGNIRSKTGDSVETVEKKLNSLLDQISK